MYMYNNVFDKEERIGLIFSDLSDGMFKKMCCGHDYVCDKHKLPPVSG